MLRTISAIFLITYGTFAIAAERTVRLDVAYKTVHFRGRAVQAIAVNNQIPAPTLHFKQGDHVTLDVHNHLHEGTAIHWHGLLVPWQMDGVAGISQEAIPPGGHFQYTFTLRQSGTYWYHAHAGLQEQQGLYGAFLIDPPAGHRSKKPDRDYSIVLSDWSNTHPDRILANLKNTGDYYAPAFPLQPSLARFIHDYRHADKAEREQLWDDYHMMQQMRMSLYDISDVAYDAFLLNGHTAQNPWTAPVKKGDTVRLRFIGAGADTVFRIKIPGTRLQIIQADGNNVRPYTVSDFTLAPGETFDVLVHITHDAPYIIYAESADAAGSTMGILSTASSKAIHPVKPFPEPRPVTREMMHSMPISHSSMSMDHGNMDMGMHFDHTAKMEGTQTTQTTGTKYQSLTAAVPTNDPGKKPEKTLHMDLNGWMGQFIWFINGVPEHEAPPIIIKPGKRYRFIFTNQSMMHHPMHIHGHWLILRNGHGKYDPLLHTIDVPPSATVVADLDTDASGQWFSHCHMLYHMISGMSRVFQYSSVIQLEEGKNLPQHAVSTGKYINRPIVRIDDAATLNPALIHHPMPHPHGFYFANSLDAGFDPSKSTGMITFQGRYGTDSNKLQLFINDAEIKHGTVENADMDIFLWHPVAEFWALKGGINYFYRPAKTPYWQLGAGIEGTLPWFIETDIRAYTYAGSFKGDIELTRDTQIAGNFLIKTALRGIFATQTVPNAFIGAGMNQAQITIRPYYRLMPGLSFFLEYQYQKALGTYRTLQENAGNAASDNTLTLGISVIF